jgi:hypothetical protein
MINQRPNIIGTPLQVMFGSTNKKPVKQPAT